LPGRRDGVDGALFCLCATALPAADLLVFRVPEGFLFATIQTPPWMRPKLIRYRRSSLPLAAKPLVK
jgi:hypothetical protein